MKLGELLGKRNKNEGKAAEKKPLPKLVPGMRLEIMTENNRLIFLGEITQIEPGVVQVEDVEGVSLPYIEYNTSLKLRGFCEGKPFCLEGVITGSTMRFWRVEKLSTLQSGERRNYFRQNVRLEGRAVRIGSPFERGAAAEVPQEPPVDCVVANLSASGAMVLAPFGWSEGDWIRLENLRVEPKEPPFTLTCSIRRVMEHEDLWSHSHRAYGCEFYGLEGEEQERLIKLILQLQHRELRARRGDPDDE